MRKLLILFLFLSCTLKLNAQGKSYLRVNMINPSIGFEKFTKNNKLSFSTEVGVGYSISFEDIDTSAQGLVKTFGPFVDIQSKYHYNVKKRADKNKKENSTNFVSLRAYTIGEFIYSNIERDKGYEFIVGLGPTWGLQRIYGKKVHFLFDMGPIVFVSQHGVLKTLPINLQINIGFNLNN